ncbi:hypothetical protein JCM10212_003373 [Sporobolomyces blumeae]
MAKVGPAKRNVVPVALVSAAPEAVLVPYASQIISSLQALHPQTQLLVTCITPTSHSIPINPFLPPTAFLSALPAFARRPTRPASTLWQSTTGMLRAIKLARRRLVEGAMAGAGGEGRAQLPKYVVVVSGTDVENPGRDEVSWEDDDGDEKWEVLAKNFTKGQHCTTLFSLISLGSTPNLEAFWRESSGKFPPHLIYNSTSSSPPAGFSFPLVSPQHACFLIGFYNANRPPQNPTASSSAPAPTTQQASSNGAAGSPVMNAKRPAPSSPAVSLAAKKSKPNPPPANSTNSTGTPAIPSNSPPNPAGAFLTGNRVQQQPTPPNSTRSSAPGTVNSTTTPSSMLQSPAQRANGGSPSIAPPLPPTLTNESLQQYINEMKAAAARTGLPPPSAQDIQSAAMAAYANAHRSAGSTASVPPPPSMTPRSTGSAQLAGGGGGGGAGGTPSMGAAPPLIPQSISQLTPQQINQLPPIPSEMKAKIEAHLEIIKTRVRSGQMTQEAGELQVKRLQDLANHQRLKMYQESLQQKQSGQAQPSTGQGQAAGLGLNISPSLAHARTNSTTPQPHQNPPSSFPAHSQTPISTLQPHLRPGPPQQQQQQQQQGSNPPKPQRQDSMSHKPIWRGAISWALTEASGARKEFTIFCEAAPMQSSAARDLAEVSLPQTFRISSLSQLKMSVLQELASKHALPAISLTPLSNSVLPPELVKKQEANGHNNEALYTMFAQSIEHRSNCGIVRFSGSPHGLVLVAVPNQNKLLAIVFSKIPLPSDWTQASSANPGAQSNQQQQHSRTSTNQSISTPQTIPRPLSSQSQTGMFSSPATYPVNLPQSIGSQSNQQLNNPMSFVPQPQQQQHNPYLGQPFAGSSYQPQPPPATQSFNYTQPPMMTQQQQQQPQAQQQQPPPASNASSSVAPVSFPAGGVAGMDFAELQKLLGAEQLNALMSGI